MPLRPTSLSDKTLHSLAYVLQAVTLLWALWRSYRPGWRGAVLTFAYTIMLVIGLAFIFTHQLWMRNIYNRMMRRKYILLEGFRSSR